VYLQSLPHLLVAEAGEVVAEALEEARKFLPYRRNWLASLLT
jgi:hypothetical protein